MAGEFLTALGLLLVIEGAVYALFPQPMKKLLLHVLGMPLSSMRIAGLISAGAGVFLVWLLRG